MNPRTKYAILAAAAGLALIGGGGAALATSGGGSGPAQARAAFLADVASHLGVPTAKLEAAIRAAALDRVDAALRAGRITQARADELESRIRAGGLPLGPWLGPGLGFGRGAGPGLPGLGRHGLGPGRELEAAAKAIGIDVPTLLDALRGGRTIAAVAAQHGVSAGAVEQAMVARAKADLDAAVSAGRLTKDEASQLLDRLTSRIAAIVEGAARGPLHGFRMHGFRMHGGLDDRSMAPGT